MKIKNIIRGWWNYFFRKPEIEEIAKKRLEVCNKCPGDYKTFSIIKFSYVCGICSCPLQKKVRCSEEYCDKGYWED